MKSGLYFVGKVIYAVLTSRPRTISWLDVRSSYMPNEVTEIQIRRSNGPMLLSGEDRAFAWYRETIDMHCDGDTFTLFDQPIERSVLRDSRTQIDTYRLQIPAWRIHCSEAHFSYHIRQYPHDSFSLTSYSPEFTVELNLFELATKGFLYVLDSMNTPTGSRSAPTISFSSPRAGDRLRARSTARVQFIRDGSIDFSEGGAFRAGASANYVAKLTFSCDNQSYQLHAISYLSSSYIPDSAQYDYVVDLPADVYTCSKANFIYTLTRDDKTLLMAGSSPTFTVF